MRYYFLSFLLACFTGHSFAIQRNRFRFQRRQAPDPDPIPDQPATYDGESPPEACFLAMEQLGGYIWFGNDSGCVRDADNEERDQKGKIESAVWEATGLASYAQSKLPDETLIRSTYSAGFYMGSDWRLLKNRLVGNLRRAYEFKTPKTSKKRYIAFDWPLPRALTNTNLYNSYITVSCNDPKNWCNQRVEGKAVGGYAWEYDGWFGYYHYV